MAVNNMDFNQLATVLTELTQQATGEAQITPTNSAEFTSVGTTALAAGYDKLATAISQVLSRTIFSIRPYSRRFRGLEADSYRWGSVTRKLSLVDKDFEDATRFELEDNTAPPSMFTVHKPEVVQENFYGANIFDKAITIYRDQLDQAFQNEAQFSEFITMLLTNVSDMREQSYETMSRATIANLVGGIVAGPNATNQVIHLLTEYNEQTGLSLTDVTVYAPENFPAFIKWVYARVAELSSLLTERTAIYHTNIEDKVIRRHTPYDRQKVYLYAPLRYQIDARVIADVFHDSYLRFADTESVNFWQSLETPDEVQTTPVYLGTDGVLVTGEATTVSKLFGVIFDEDAAGVQFFNEWAAPTPFDSRNGMYNNWYHWTLRYWNSFTENAFVLCLD